MDTRRFKAWLGRYLRRPGAPFFCDFIDHLIHPLVIHGTNITHTSTQLAEKSPAGRNPCATSGKLARETRCPATPTTELEDYHWSKDNEDPIQMFLPRDSGSWMNLLDHKEALEAAHLHPLMRLERYVRPRGSKVASWQRVNWEQYFHVTANERIVLRRENTLYAAPAMLKTGVPRRRGRPRSHQANALHLALTSRRPETLLYSPDALKLPPRLRSQAPSHHSAGPSQKHAEVPHYTLLLPWSKPVYLAIVAGPEVTKPIHSTLRTQRSLTLLYSPNALKVPPRLRSQAPSHHSAGFSQKYAEVLHYTLLLPWSKPVYLAIVAGPEVTKPMHSTLRTQRSLRPCSTTPMHEKSLPPLRWSARIRHSGWRSERGDLHGTENWFLAAHREHLSRALPPTTSSMYRGGTIGSLLSQV
ncbi:hypothetical protein C8R44DRAFT_866334 [Mycena epipterygia]|nr:hypothetical protein C8R44DRAFT_866334 [Mycena epipterygia]